MVPLKYKNLKTDRHFESWAGECIFWTVGTRRDASKRLFDPNRRRSFLITKTKACPNAFFSPNPNSIPRMLNTTYINRFKRESFAKVVLNLRVKGLTLLSYFPGLFFLARAWYWLLFGSHKRQHGRDGVEPPHTGETKEAEFVQNDSGWRRGQSCCSVGSISGFFFLSETTTVEIF